MSLLHKVKNNINSISQVNTTPITIFDNINHIKTVKSTQEQQLLDQINYIKQHSNVPERPLNTTSQKNNSDILFNMNRRLNFIKTGEQQNIQISNAKPIIVSTAVELSNIPMQQYNSDKHISFVIDSIQLNKPLVLISEQKYLTCDPIKNIVSFSDKYLDDNSQKWIIEQPDPNQDVFYIKTTLNRGDFTCYLGSPNKDGNVYLYTSKTLYTQWVIRPTGNMSFDIKYIGERFDNTKLTLVIARYKEDIQWALPYNDIAIVYNKGEPNLTGFVNIVKIDNIGREGHTYLHHIIKNYSNLSDRVIFCQGNPFDHNETILYGLDNADKHMDVQPLGLVWLRRCNIPPQKVEDKYKTITDYGLNYMLIDIDGDCNTSEFFDKGIMDLNVNCRKDYNAPEFKNISILEGFLKRCNFVSEKPVDKIPFTYSGLFSVSKSKITKHGIKTYKDILIEMITNGINGYLLERLWMYIFQD
jgi:hypothetical protein